MVVYELSGEALVADPSRECGHAGESCGSESFIDTLNP